MKVAFAERRSGGGGPGFNPFNRNIPHVFSGPFGFNGFVFNRFAFNSFFFDPFFFDRFFFMNRFGFFPAPEFFFFPRRNFFFVDFAFFPASASSDRLGGGAELVGTWLGLVGPIMAMGWPSPPPPAWGSNLLQFQSGFVRKAH